MCAEVEHRGLPDARRVQALRVLSRDLLAYVDQVTGQLAEVYQTERDRLLRSQERKRAALTRELLAGMPVSEEELGYRLRVDHIGVVAWGRNPEASATQLAQELGCALLIAGGGGRSVWAWLVVQRNAHPTSRGRCDPPARGTPMYAGTTVGEAPIALRSPTG